MKKINIFSVFLFITVAILVCGFSFVKVSAEKDILGEKDVKFVYVDEDITKDTIWYKASSPYVVTDSVSVEEGATLTIEPGVVVKFDSEFSFYSNPSIDVYGKIIANGTEAEPIYFTSNYDDVGGSTDDDYEDCEYESYVEDEYGDPVGIGKKTCVYRDSKSSKPSAKDWDGIYIDSSVGSSFKNVFLKYADNSFYIYSSSINFENLNINDSASGIVGDLDSVIKVAGGSFDNMEEAFQVYDNSSLEVEDMVITNVKDGFYAYTSNNYKYKNPDPSLYGNTFLTITNSTLDCTRDGINVFNNYSLKIKGGSISCVDDNIYIYNDVVLDIDNVKIIGKIAAGKEASTSTGITAYNNTKPDSIFIKNSEIAGHKNGFVILDSVFSAHNNSIHDNTNKGVDNYSLVLLDFTSNFWGDKTGPGDAVSDNITWSPFLKYDPTKETISNVMFIPGFQASRLYKEEGNDGDGTYYENKIWEPGLLSDPSSMYMDENGESIDKGIYTREVMGRAKLLGIGVLDFYKSFFDKLDGMVTDGEIGSWKEIAYDWRLSPLDIVKRGVEDSDGNISYGEELAGGEVSYIIGELQKLVDTSNSDKVTIVTHSNGGLVAKALIAKLIEMKSDLIYHIDNLIVVAPPLVGTPKATAGILHGYEQGMFFNLFLGRKDARDLGETLPGAYGLLPSEKYLSEVNNNLILLDPSLDKLNDWRSKYGDAIDTYQEFKNFLLDNLRLDGGHNDLVNPSILNGNILEKVGLLHSVIDNLEIPSNIKVHQVAGFGLPTANDIRYKSKNECIFYLFPFCLKKKVVLSVDTGFTSGGDSTVVGGSALFDLFGVGEKYYLNLEEYNKDSKLLIGKDHANIFEVPDVYDLVHNILKNDDSLPSYVTSIAPSPVDYTIIKIRSPVAIDIYDDSGLHTGIVEGINGEEDMLEEGISNSLYMEIGENKYIVVPKDGDYTLKLDGLSDGIFTLEQEQLVNDMPGDSVVWRDIPTTALFQGEVALNGGMLATSIVMDEDGDGTFESNLAPVDKSLEQEKDNTTRGSSGSYIIKDTIPPNVILGKEDNVKLENINKEENIKIVKDLEKREEVKSEMVVNNMDKIIPVNNLSASVGLVDFNLDKRFILLINIVLSVLIIIVGIKFINKVK